MNETEQKILELVSSQIRMPASDFAVCKHWDMKNFCGIYFIPSLDLTAKVWVDEYTLDATGCTIKL